MSASCCIQTDIHDNTAFMSNAVSSLRSEKKYSMLACCMLIMRRDMTLFIVTTTEQKRAVSPGQPITGKHLSHHTGILYTINTTSELCKQPPSDVEQTSDSRMLPLFGFFASMGMAEWCVSQGCWHECNASLQVKTHLRWLDV